MKLSIPIEDLCNYYVQQLNNFFPDKNIIGKEEISRVLDLSLDRLNYCFKHVAFNRYNDGEQTLYNHLYADHNIVFIWLLSSTAFKVSENQNLSSKLYYLNKVLHSFDCMYDTALPDIFLIFHGAGTMLGKAKYADYFVALQGCTVGSQKGVYPKMGRGVSLTAHSALIGNCDIGDRVTIAAYTSVFEENISNDKIVFRNKRIGSLELKESNECYAQQFFKNII